MLLYQSRLRDPFFNIAAEEYFLRHFDQDFIYLYINEPSIIIGKHQNTTAEINVPYVFENNIKVVRRLSGGGTVYHDGGNLNFCFIQKGAEGYLVDFKKYTQPILATLQGLGVKAYLKGKSDLVIDELKISGNAEHVYRNKVLHHGTLLFASELGALNLAIKADWSKFNDRAVRSNRSSVTNIIDHLNVPLSIDEFRIEILNTLLKLYPDVEFYQLTAHDEQAINKLVNEKYSQWEWNFGYSPEYSFSQSYKLNGDEFSLHLKIHNGLIQKARLTQNGKEFDGRFIIENVLTGQPHHYPEIKEKLKSVYKEYPQYPFPFSTLMQLLF